MAVSKTLQNALNSTPRPEVYEIVNERGEKVRTSSSLKTVNACWKCVDYHNANYRAYNRKFAHDLGEGRINFVHVKTRKVKVSFIFNKEKGFVFAD